MRSITLAKALSLKNTLAGEVSKFAAVLASRSSYEEGRRTATDEKTVNETYIEYLAKVANLTELKVAIRLGNIPITKQLVELEETKSLLTQTAVLAFDERWDAHYGSEKEVHRLPNFDQKAIADSVKTLQNRIEVLQDEITAFNHTNKIEITF